MSERPTLPAIHSAPGGTGDTVSTGVRRACRRWIIAAALLVSPALAGQPTGVLRVTIALPDPDGQSTPVARHVLLISDNPATTIPRVVRTAADGSVEVKLAPGTYTVESERAVTFHGQAYEWFQMIDVADGQTATLALTIANAEMAEPGVHAPSGPESDPTFLFGQWHRSVVAIWSAHTRATGFVVDARGLIATRRDAVGSGATAAVQISDTVKVPATVLAADASRDVAMVWVGPALLADRPPLPLACPPDQPPAVEDADEIVAIAAEWGRPIDTSWGRVTGLRPRAIDTDMRLSFGGTGGPVFNEAGVIVGLTSTRVDPERHWHDTEIIRTVHVCEALSAAQSAMAGAAAPEPVSLPVESTRPYPTHVLEDAARPSRAGVPPDVVTSEDFDIAFITPPVIHEARQKADWTGGRSGRPPEVEARLGRLTDFAAWSDYFVDAPAVLVVRVTPRMVEGFWKRVAREAARTQGAELPPFKSFKTSFVQMTLVCGGSTVPPIHPFVLDHQLSDTDTVREGLYVFAPDAIGPHCNGVQLTLQSGQAPGKPQTITVPPQIVERIWNDFAAWRDLPH